MSTSGATETQVRTYGNWRHPRLAGLGKLSFFQTMALLGLLIVSILVYGSLGLARAAVLLLSGLSVLGAMEIRDAHGVSVWDKMVERVSFARRRGAGPPPGRYGPHAGVTGGGARLACGCGTRWLRVCRVLGGVELDAPCTGPARSALSRVGARAFLACSQDRASASTLIRTIDRLPSSTTAALM